MRRRNWLPLLLLAGLLLGGCGRASDELRVTLLSVGKADAIVLQCGGETMVIDTGESDDGKKLLRFLSDRGIERVDVLLITHFDKDHVGGAARLAEKLPPGRVLLPDYESERPEYRALLEVLAQKGIEPERLSEPLRFSLGGARVLAEPPAAYPAGVGDNDLSLIVTVSHGENRLLFMGDSEKQRIRQWLSEGERERCAFLKLPHHGAYDRALPELLAAVEPEIAVICDSDKNPAEEQTLALLAQSGTAAYETRSGSVAVTSDGRRLWVEQDG